MFDADNISAWSLMCAVCFQNSFNAIKVITGQIN